jgi:hypothetical protein
VLVLFCLSPVKTEARNQDKKEGGEIGSKNRWSMTRVLRLRHMNREVQPPRLDQQEKPRERGYSKAAHNRVEKLLNRDPQEIDMEAFDKNTKEFLKLHDRTVEMLDKLDKKQRG